MRMPHELSAAHLSNVEEAAAHPVRWQNWVKGRLQPVMNPDTCQLTDHLGLQYDFDMRYRKTIGMLV
jgi:hypothetical protein